MVKIQKEEMKPICPYCERALDRLTQVKGGWFEINRVFACPHCRKVLGFSAGT